MLLATLSLEVQYLKKKIDSLKLDLKEMNVKYYHISIPRKLTDRKNLKLSYQQTKKLIDKEKYALIHCHSPIGGMICRLANKNSSNYEHSRMIYTAHGFHFFKGNNPLKNFLFRNIEKYGAKYTDTLITINKEDYEATKKFKLRKNGTVEYIPGVGIDLDKINSIDGNKEKLCNELNISKDSILLLSVGELNDNKNHRVVIEALPSLPNNMHYLICGVGPLKDKHIQLSKELGVEKRLHLLGYRNNIIEIMKSCDIFVFPSKREGLSVALMEAMASGLPCVASNIRGNKDLINNKNSVLVNSNVEWVSKIMIIQKNNVKTDKKNVSKYEKKYIIQLMNNIYDGLERKILYVK